MEVKSDQGENGFFSANSQPKKSEIIVRIIKPTLDESVPRYWYDNNPFLSHFLNALSIIFPPGEETFVNSVNHYRERVKDQTLRKDIKSFVSQESNHSHLHLLMNAWIARGGKSAQKYQEEITNLIEKMYRFVKKMSPLTSLATTAGYEHLTAIMAVQLLKREDVVGKMAGDIKNIFILHAIEEIEHKSVAYDVYRVVKGGYFLRATSYLVATVFLAYMITITTHGLLKEDRRDLTLKSGFSALRQLFGFKGFFTGLLPSYLRYFKPGFHPKDIKDQDLLIEWRSRLALSIEVKEMGPKRPVDQLKSNLHEGVGA